LYKLSIKVKPGVFGVHIYERPPMPKCPGPSAFRQSKWQELHLEATSLRDVASPQVTQV
jgi:hypothetical protein